MNHIDIVIPVRNEEKNIWPLVSRIDRSLEKASIPYTLIFIDDRSTDRTLEIINTLKEVYPIQVFSKKGRPGKAYSILEAVDYSTSPYIVMLDADLQYPPEAIPFMVEMIQNYGVIVANRNYANGSKVRKFFSKAFSFGFGKLLHGFDIDVQSGLKLFRKDILEYIDKKKITPWTLDLSLLITARELGYQIGAVNVNFEKRVSGESKVHLFKTSTEIGKNALRLKFRKDRTFVIRPNSGSMVDTVVIHNRKRLVTHTDLELHHSALTTFTFWQKFLIGFLLSSIIFGFITNPLFTAITIIALLTFIYFIDVLFNVFIIFKSLHFPPEIISSDYELNEMDPNYFPIYTILCPLYKEAKMIPYFLKSIEKINWPKDKLDVIFLLEEDDKETIQKANATEMPSYVRTIVVPDSQPKTKPKACNYGLNFAKGEFIVIYDAEDNPDPMQLKKAYSGFLQSQNNVVCLQAKLNYFNPHQNLLTKFFTAEYSLWFEVMLTGFQTANTIIPLGGTSNHFKTKILKDLKGWDPFNVTEDCDLGVRLFKAGYKTAVIDSTTLEEANSNPRNWLRQRSRWLKGYMQTYLVHMRNPIEFIKSHGVHALIFQLIIGARISFILINPFLWLMTFSYFVFYQYTSVVIESIFPSIVFYMAVFSLIFGNFLSIFNYMIGCAKKDHWSLIKYIYLIPIYWLMASAAAFIALYQLVTKPHYWEKTHHGLHLNKKSETTELNPFLKPVFSPMRFLFNSIF